MAAARVEWASIRVREKIKIDLQSSGGHNKGRFLSNIAYK
jgi:hypothetical protein